MAYLLLAKLVVVAHLGFVAFVFLGGYLLAARGRLAWLHLTAFAYALLVTVVGWPCPLTLLEQWLLARAGRPVYSGEFLPHYLWSHVGLSGAELPVAAGLIVAIVAANFVPYRSRYRGLLSGR